VTQNLGLFDLDLPPIKQFSVFSKAVKVFDHMSDDDSTAREVKW